MTKYFLPESDEYYRDKVVVERGALQLQGHLTVQTTYSTKTTFIHKINDDIEPIYY